MWETLPEILCLWISASRLQSSLNLKVQTAYDMTGPCHCLKTLEWPQISFPNETSLSSGPYNTVALIKQTAEYKRIAKAFIVSLIKYVCTTAGVSGIISRHRMWAKLSKEWRLLAQSRKLADVNLNCQINA